jgi:hypothetical protein
MFWEALLRDLRGEWKNRNIHPQGKKNDDDDNRKHKT